MSVARCTDAERGHRLRAVLENHVKAVLDVKRPSWIMPRQLPWYSTDRSDVPKTQSQALEPYESTFIPPVRRLL